MQRTIVDQVEVEPSGRVGIRLRKQTLSGDKVVSERFHRTAVDPDGDIDAQMAEVNSHLTQTGAVKYAPVTDWSKVHQVLAAAKASGSDAKLVVDFTRNAVSLVRDGATERFDVRKRGAFLAACPDAVALHDLAFPVDACVADDAAVAKAAADKLAEEQRAEAARLARIAKAREDFDAAVERKVRELMGARV